MTFALGIITGLILGSIFGYRMRARQAELDVEAVRIDALLDGDHQS